MTNESVRHARHVDPNLPQGVEIVATAWSWGQPKRLCFIDGLAGLHLGWRTHEPLDLIPDEWLDEDGEYVEGRRLDEGSYRPFASRGVPGLHIPAFLHGQAIGGVDVTDEPTLLQHLSDEQDGVYPDQRVELYTVEHLRELLNLLGWDDQGHDLGEKARAEVIADRLLASIHDARPTVVQPGTIKAYLDTSYVVDADTSISLSVGEHSNALKELMRGMGETMLAFITAFNPEGARRSNRVNTLADAHLRQDIADLGLPSLEGRGVGNDEGWPPEPSHAVFGLSYEDAVHLGRAHGQNAIIWAEHDCVPRLVLPR